MNVAINGDRGSCLTHELAPGAYVFALARGFGSVGGTPVASFVLGRLRLELERRIRGKRFMRAMRRPRGISSALAGGFRCINAELNARSGSNDDYVNAACSLTAAVLAGNRVHLAHVGTTTAFVARDGVVVALTKNDSFEDAGLPILTRSLGSASSVEAALTSFTLSDGDSLVLTASRSRSEQALTVHFAIEPLGEPAQIYSLRALGLGLSATLMFYAMLCLR